MTRGLINFARPVHCTRCGERMRPTASTVAWPAEFAVYGRAGVCQACLDGEPDRPAPASPAEVPATPTVMPRRRQRRRFDYHPDVLSICPSCGAEYDVVAGVCRCNRPS